MKKLCCWILAVCFCLSCFIQGLAEGAPDYTSGTPWPEIDLEGVVTEETPAELKDNFALYANRDKILNLKIPEGSLSAGTMYTLAGQVQKEIRNMFLGEAPESHDAKLAYDLFWLMMDWDKRNETGTAPLKKMIDRIEEISSLEELNSYFTEVPDEDQLYSLWSSGAMVDFVDSSRYVLAVMPAGLTLGDSAEYTSLSQMGQVTKDAISELVRKVLVKMGYTEEEAAEKTENCYAYETKVAAGIPDSVTAQTPEFQARYAVHSTRAQIREIQQKLPVLEMLEKTFGYPEADDYLIPIPEFFSVLNEVYTEENLPLIKDYMIVQGILGAAGYLDRECYDWVAECRSTISGTQGRQDDGTVFSGVVSALLPWPVARLYTEKYLREEDKVRISSLIDEVLEAYHGIIEEADFLSAETRAKAIEKLDCIGKQVLYPDDWTPYSYEDLDFASPEDGGTCWDAVMAILRHQIVQTVRTYQKPVDKEIWGDTPVTVNCQYSPFTNSVMILGAFARGEFYHSGMSDEELYGKMGVIIGHEISHAFDSSGAQFDKDGNMVNWWTPEDLAVFQEKNDRMAAFYSNIRIWDGQPLYGQIVTGEACADMAGMKVILRIVAGREGFDYDAFFRAFADCYITRDNLTQVYRRLYDVHPMPYLRINVTLQHFDEFLDFYGIREGDGMYLAPEDRVNIW